MIENNRIYITESMFFETKMPKHKPISVNGREFYSLTYRYSGKASITVDGVTLVSAADSITFMPKGLSYVTEVIEDVHMATVHFDFECEAPPNKPVVINAENTVFRSLFKTLVKNGSDETSDLLKMSMLYEILAELNRLNLTAAKRTIPEKIMRSRKMLDSDYCDPYLSIGAIAESIGVSPAYLRREFHASFGISPIRYLKRLRIEKAKQLLLTEQQPVAVTAKECGYTSVSYFIQDFHRSTGESPGGYRERLLDTP